jgi:parallel beta-helix repeat protein
MKNLKYSIGCLLIIIIGMGMVYAGDGQIDIAVLPYTISKPGSYIVTRDLTLTTLDTSGITITTGSVTLDLNGHRLKGPGKTAGVTGSGIGIPGYVNNIIIQNGTVCDWRSTGVAAYTAENSQFEALCCYNNGYSGIEAGYGCKITGNTCSSNGESGILAGKSTIIGNTCRLNGGAGIIGSPSCTIQNNTCINNTGTGIAGGYGSTIINNCCMGSGSHGISANSSTIIGNTLQGNTGSGIYANSSNLVRENTCEGNKSHGIEIGDSNRVVENTCLGSGIGAGYGAGIYASNCGNSIEHNLVNNNDTGIDCSVPTRNFIASNRAYGNTTDYNIIAGNVWGAITNMTAGGPIATTDPYANFRF